MIFFFSSLQFNAFRVGGGCRGVVMVVDLKFSWKNKWKIVEYKRKYFGCNRKNNKILELLKIVKMNISGYILGTFRVQPLITSGIAT